MKYLVNTFILYIHDDWEFKPVATSPYARKIFQGIVMKVGIVGMFTCANKKLLFLRDVHADFSLHPYDIHVKYPTRVHIYVHS